MKKNGKEYVSLKKIINLLLEKKCKVKMEYRKKKYKFGSLNYGDVPGFYNLADGDPWDIFAPGYENELPLDRFYKVKGIIGIFMLENGNHKIAVKLYVPGYSKNRADSEIKKYCKTYTLKTKHVGKWISFTI